MKDFDSYIKERAKQESINMPLHTTQVINKQLRALEERKSKEGFIRLKRRIIIPIVVATVALGGVILANDLPQKIINGIRRFFESSPGAKYETDEFALNKLEQPIGLAAEKDGVALQIESVALDDNFLNIFYTMHSQEVIPKQDEQGNVAWLYAPGMKLKIDGQPWEYMNNGQNTDAYLEDEYTIKVMERINVAHLQLPKKFELEVDFINPCQKEGEWIINIPVEKLETPSRIINVNESRQINTTTAYRNHQEEGKTIFDICVEKVIFSPLASQIVISEKNVEGKEPFSNFVLFDQDGNNLDIITQWAGISGEMKDEESRNGFEFIASDNLEKLILVPMQFHRIMDEIEAGVTYEEKLEQCEKEYPSRVEIPIEQIPCEIKRGPLISYNILSLETNQDAMTLKFKIQGTARNQLLKTELYLLDREKHFMAEKGIRDIAVDRETGIYTLRITHAKQNGEKVDFTKAKYITIDDGGYLLPEELLWGQAIEIDLS